MLAGLGGLDGDQHRLGLAGSRAHLEHGEHFLLGRVLKVLAQAPAGELEVLVGVELGQLVALEFIRFGQRSKGPLDLVVWPPDDAPALLHQDLPAFAGDLPLDDPAVGEQEDRGSGRGEAVGVEAARLVGDRRAGPRRCPQAPGWSGRP